MTMPEASMYENHGSVLGKNYVGFARQGGDILAIPEPPGKEVFSDQYLRLGLLAGDMRHDPASLLSRELICQGDRPDAV